MICRSCGMEYDDSLPVCPTCGEKEGDAENTRKDRLTWDGAARESASDAFSEQNDARSFDSEENNSGYREAPPYTEGQRYVFGRPAFTSVLPMKWHIFLVYFGIWAVSFGSFSDGLLSLAGSLGNFTSDVFSAASAQQFLNNGELLSADAFYALYPVMKTFDAVYGALLIALGIFGTVTGFALLKMKKSAPKIFVAFCGCYFGIKMLYTVVVTYVIRDSGSRFGADTVLSLAFSALASAALVYANYVYYKKRKHLFVN